jgi:hypothetical protein
MRFERPPVLVESGHLGYSRHLAAGDWLINSAGLSRQVEQAPVDGLDCHSHLILYLVHMDGPFRNFSFPELVDISFESITI